MESEIQNRRKNYFIKKRFQTNFIIKFCVLIVIGSIISGALIYLMSRSTVTTTFENSRLTLKSTADFILPSVLLSSVIVIALISLATIAVTLFTSHRIAGPLYRIEKDVQKVASGDFTKKFHLRKADEIKALAESLDNMTDSLRSDVETIRQKIKELESLSQSEEAKEKIKSIKAILSKFIT